MSVLVSQGLEGIAAPAVPGDTLDATSQSNSESSSPSSDSEVPTFKQPSSEGLSLITKLFLATVLVGGCVAFVKSRRDHQASWREKSRA
jgi:hypothetical protein